MAERITRQRQSGAARPAPTPPPAAAAAAEPAAPRRRGTAERTVPAPPAAAAPDQGPPGERPGAREDTRSQEVFAPPPVDIFEDDGGLVVVADLPGVEPGGLDVRVEQGVLTIQGRPQALTAGTPLHREFELTGFFRQFQLPEEIDTERIEAQLTQGVLTLRLPRAAPAAPRRIEVRGA